MKKLFYLPILLLSVLLINCNDDDTEEKFDEPTIEYSTITLTDKYEFNIHYSTANEFIIYNNYFNSFESILYGDKSTYKDIYVGILTDNNYSYKKVPKENIYGSTLGLDINNENSITYNYLTQGTEYEFACFEKIDGKYLLIKNSEFKLTYPLPVNLEFLSNENATLHNETGIITTDTKGVTLQFKVTNLQVSELKQINFLRGESPAEEKHGGPIYEKLEFSFNDDILSIKVPERIECYGGCFWEIGEVIATFKIRLIGRANYTLIESNNITITTPVETVWWL